MAGPRRVPNDQLRVLLAEADWTGHAFARQVNVLGAEAGLALRYQRASVTQWISGMRPRPPVPELAAEALSRRLGRLVTVRETGLDTQNTSPSMLAQQPWWSDDLAERLRELRASTGTHRQDRAGGVYSAAALTLPAWDDLVSWMSTGKLVHGEQRARIGRPELSSAKSMVALFSDADLVFGGGQLRTALAAYLDSTIAPWLRAATSPGVRRELLITAARLCYLCGFMCFDDELHGAAQRYYLSSLRLSAEAGEPGGYAVTLRALSVQARLLGHVRQAVHLAEAAVESASARVPAKTSAFLFGQLAVAHAAAGSRHDATTSLRTAEAHLAHDDGSARPVGAYHRSALDHQHAAVSACLGQRRGAIAALHHSIQHRPASERRSRAITLARLAELQLADGHLEQACGTWSLFLDDYPHLRSGRADTAMATLRARLRPHQRVGAARTLLGQATRLTTARNA
ncbi:hypothetical protein [Amycolatopsis sp. cmx-8-4]|uniref:hypothetical protein n=1 Tax=Amycolatopsis sp. cmx-8-4 TaxID=2790947 RepID=UPI00397B39C0